MKRMFSLLIAVLMLLLFASCEQTPSDSSSTAGSQNESSDISSDISSESSEQSENPSSEDERYADMVAREEVVLGKMSFGKVFYRAAQVTDIYLVDITQEDEETVATLRSLQGLVARNYGGAIFLDDGSTASQFWLEYCSTEYGLYFKKATPAETVKHFSKYIKGAVEYSPDVSYEHTVAQNIAIQSDYVTVTGLSVSLVNSALTNKPLIDIRGLFKDKKSAYDYIMEKCLPTSSTRYLGLLSEDAAFFDYAYAVKALVLNLDFSESWETEMLSLLIGRPDWNDTAYVFTDHTVSSALANVFSADGFAVINMGSFSNSTVFSSASIEYNRHYASYENRALSESRIYASLYYNIESAADIQQTAYMVWSHKSEALSLSLEFYPIMYELAPPIAKWYRQNLTTNDMLVSADLGCGTANLSLMDEETALKFRQNNEYFLNVCDITVVSDSDHLYTAEEYYSQFDGLLVTEPSNTVNGVMRFTDTAGFENWLKSATPMQSSPMYFLIELPHTAFSGEDIGALSTIITETLRERKGVFEFVLTENILLYM